MAVAEAVRCVPWSESLPRSSSCRLLSAPVDRNFVIGLFPCVSAAETEKLSSRLAMAKVLLTLVPAKVVTKDMLIEAVGRISSLFDDIRMDAPMAAKWIGEVLSTG